MNLCLLDTDILSEVLKQKHPQVICHAAEYFSAHGEFAFSAITKYEILRGLLEKGATLQLERFANFCTRSLVLEVNDDILDRAARLWADARRRGLPARDADLMIAATALAENRTLVTGNTDHFSWLSGLNLQDWREPSLG